MDEVLQASTHVHGWAQAANETNTAWTMCIGKYFGGEFESKEVRIEPGETGETTRRETPRNSLAKK